MSKINEQKLDYHISIRNIRGEKDDGISNCFGEACKNIQNTQQKRVCSEDCHQRILLASINKLSSVMMTCNAASHPVDCRKNIQRMVLIYKNRINTSKKRMRDAKAEMLAVKSLKRGK